MLAEKARGGHGLDEKQLGAVFTAGAWSKQGGQFLVGRGFTLFYRELQIPDRDRTRTE